MARQVGIIKITSTIDDICFYKMSGDYFARMKSSLSGKRFWKDKAFEGSRKSCERFTKGNRVASKVYALLEKDKKSGKLISFLRGRAIRLLKESTSEKKTEELLIDYLVEFGLLKPQEQEISVADRKQEIPFARETELQRCVFYTMPVKKDSS